MRSFVLAIVVCVVFSACSNRNSRYSEIDLPAYIFDTCLSFSIATFESTDLTEHPDLVEGLTGTIIFAEKTDSMVSIMLSNPKGMLASHKVAREKGFSLKERFNCANISFVSYEGKKIGLVPRHLFEQDINLQRVFAAKGLETGSNDKFISAVMPEWRDAGLEYTGAFDSLAVKDIVGSQATMEAYDIFGPNEGVYHYKITGTVNHLSKDYCTKIGLTDYVQDHGVYVMRVPFDLARNARNLAGTSVVVTKNGKTELFGVQAFMMGLAKGKEDDDGTEPVMLFAFLPLTKEDFTEFGFD